MGKWHVSTSNFQMTGYLFATKLGVVFNKIFIDNNCSFFAWKKIRLFDFVFEFLPLFIAVMNRRFLIRTKRKFQNFPNETCCWQMLEAEETIGYAKCDYRLIHSENVSFCSYVMRMKTGMRMAFRNSSRHDSLSVPEQFEILKTNQRSYKSIKCPIGMKSSYLKTTITESTFAILHETEKFLINFYFEGRKKILKWASSIPASKNNSDF